MGAGKSTVGRALAGRLGLRFVDTDAEIERDAGCAIREIFASEGESGFRARERRAVEACPAGDAVVALGGGALAQPTIRERVRLGGALVYLRARPETLLARVGSAAARPLLAGLEPAERLARLRKLLAEREAAYAEAALCVDADAASVEEIVEELVRGLDELGAGHSGSVAS